jgi:hypothetical protein
MEFALRVSFNFCGSFCESGAALRVGTGQLRSWRRTARAVDTEETFSRIMRNRGARKASYYRSRGCLRCPLLQSVR